MLSKDHTSSESLHDGSAFSVEIAANKHVDHRQGKGDRLPGVGRQAIEGSPLTYDEIRMFEMFEREGGSPEQRRAHILALGGLA